MCLRGLVLLSVACLMVSAELPDENDVTVIQQRTACPTIYCPWNCERFVDHNGCLFCGRCNPKTQCPPIKCPNLPYFGCVARVGRDGCTTCKCRAKPKNVCGPMPMCSIGCSVHTDVNGCQKCLCPPAPHAPTHCQEGPSSPCKRPDCFRERGADGCFHCICPDDVYSCPEVRCDPKKRCVHIIDSVTGCATGCQCEMDNNNVHKLSKPMSNRMPIPMAQHTGVNPLKTQMRG